MSKIIDLSQHNGANIDFAKIKSNGYEGVICRAGYRGYGSAGTLVKDTLFDTYYTKAKAQGLLFGAYWFSQGLTYTEGMEEALQLIECCNGKTIDYPLVIDVETSTEGNGKGRADSNTITQWEQVIKGFHSCVISNGYKSMIYCNVDYLKNRIGTRPSDMYLWLAHWVSSTSYDYDIWQYTSSGDGTNYGQSNANNALDLNIRKTDFGQGTTGGSTATNTNTSTGVDEVVKAQQGWLNNVYGGTSGIKLVVDGKTGTNTQKATIAGIQIECNKRGASLKVDGIWGTNTANAVKKYIALKNGDNGTLVQLWQFLLYCNGFTTLAIDGKFGAKTETATMGLQTKYSLTVDGIAGVNSFRTAVENMRSY